MSYRAAVKIRSLTGRCRLHPILHFRYDAVGRADNSAVELVVQVRDRAVKRSFCNAVRRFVF